MNLMKPYLSEQDLQLRQRSRSDEAEMQKVHISPSLLLLERQPRPHVEKWHNWLVIRGRLKLDKKSKWSYSRPFTISMTHSNSFQIFALLTLSLWYRTFFKDSKRQATSPRE